MSRFVSPPRELRMWKKKIGDSWDVFQGKETHPKFTHPNENRFCEDFSGGFLPLIVELRDARVPSNEKIPFVVAPSSVSDLPV